MVAKVTNWQPDRVERRARYRGLELSSVTIVPPYINDWACVSGPNAEEIARRVSPLTYVRSGLPPILSIHGDKDDVVPYSQSVRLHEALDKAKVPNQLLTIKDGGHGGFPQTDYVRSYETIWTFLRHNKIIR